MKVQSALGPQAGRGLLALFLVALLWLSPPLRLGGPGAPAVGASAEMALQALGPELENLYAQVSPGIVNVQGYLNRPNAVGVVAGSGVILDDEGHIVTNHHNVAMADEITVTFANGFETRAEVIGMDPDSDLAVLRVDSLPDGVHPLPLADSNQVRVGQWVVAIGNPFGLGNSMTLGIVSATGRAIPSGIAPFLIPEAIQTDAAINPGNSGGPLLNLEGEVLGINAQIRTNGTPVNTGVGFAIPASIVQRVAPVLISSGAYQWPWLGVRGDDVNWLLATANSLDAQQGAYIHEVEPGSPAAAAGLQGNSGLGRAGSIAVPVGGDVVLSLDGEPVIGFTDLLARLAAHSPGDAVTLTILRDGERQEVIVTLEPRPAMETETR